MLYFKVKYVYLYQSYVKNERRYSAEILLKVALNTITLIPYPKNERSSNSLLLKKKVNRESVANCLFLLLLLFASYFTCISYI